MAATNGTKIVPTTTPTPASQSANLGMAAYRAPSLFQPHRMREALADAHAGKIPPIVGFFSGLGSPEITKVVAQLGFDVVGIDWEHCAMDVSTMTQMVHDIQFVSEGKSAALVRVPGHDHASIGWALDAGASIMVPQVDTVEQAQHIVSAAKYGKSVKGHRSAPPFRLIGGVSDGRVDETKTIHQNMNRQAAIVIQIESYEGIKNLDAILTAVGDEIDSVWLGSLDARISMEFPAGQPWGQEPEWLEAVALYESTLRKHNKAASGLAMGPPEVMQRMARGRSFVFPSSDLYAIVAAACQELSSYRKTFPAMDYSEVYDPLPL